MRLKANPGFTFLPLVFVLALAVVAIGILWTWKTGTPGAPNQVPLKQLAGVTLIAAFWFYVAGKLADRKGDLVANLIVCPILALMGLAYGVALYRASKPQASKPPAIAAAGPASGQPLPDRRIPVPPPAHAPAPPATPPAGATPAPQPPPTSPPPPSAVDLAEAKARPVLEAFRTELLAVIDPAAQRAEALTKAAAKPPAHDRKVLAQRRTDAESLAKDLADIRQRLSGSTESLQKRLAESGVESIHTLGIAIRFDHEFNSASRAFACGRLGDLCRRVVEESDVLTDNFAAWRLERGEITCKDLMLKSKLTAPRFFIEADIPTVSDTLADLRGG